MPISGAYYTIKEIILRCTVVLGDFSIYLSKVGGGEPHTHLLGCDVGEPPSHLLGCDVGEPPTYLFGCDVGEPPTHLLA